MQKESQDNYNYDLREANNFTQPFLVKSIDETSKDLEKLSAQDQLQWGYEQFDEKFVLTTSFGIQSAVLLHMTVLLKSINKPKVIWIDTGYLPKETYTYAEELTKLFELDLVVAQSPISPARMEALYGRLWETGVQKDLEKYHQMRKVEPLEKILTNLKVDCWASGVRKGQTKNRQSMSHIDYIRNRLTLRPLLKWTKKDIFYYMENNNLPQHPLFEKGFSTVGDWHSSEAENSNNKGRSTRFGGLSEECGIHLNT
ncbi:phosphoadenylyl-sulfate reductase [Prochlorococcus marinus]|uniref:Phosphoadenosine 5'-phosphosulfate reductase n=1 Tax=Prochlorococcus marinus XMU1408 TaxID=2213228 RepID=A0A318RCL9_PROMR|nr:phosphoadenylyl-sulfate reductase [Prochlorococcus marinus]MBW3041140.1 phosphoadenylyl-sulfate reductase [Prochlorococcus marinus str. XMU1408]PYE03738.1 phosphoadenylyl-sulfate reductase [Prochlorococcus marinus XMU1408]